MIGVIKALASGPVDLFGFFLGGFVAQEITLTAPGLVRRVILAGTGPTGGEGGETITGVTTRAILKGIITRRDPKYYLFFTHYRSSRRAAEEFLARLSERASDRDAPVGPRAFLRQLKASKAWSQQAPQPLETIDKPVLVATGTRIRWYQAPIPTTWRAGCQGRSLSFTRTLVTAASFNTMRPSSKRLEYS